MTSSDYDVDLACGFLPWADNVFSCVVSQQVIEHLDLSRELLPLLRELYRTCEKDAEIWLACPDMRKVCESYVQDRGARLIADRRQRWSNFQIEGPPQQVINVLFHQHGQHKNLFDYELLEWMLGLAGFDECTRQTEADLLQRFPEFPRRADDEMAIYVSASCPKPSHQAPEVHSC